MPQEKILFADLALADAVQQAIAKIGYEQPSPIQAASIPHLLEGKDLLGIAQTGTGKTAAFALPILSKLDLAAKKPQALILTPTRELAIQVAEAFKSYARELKGFHVLPLYGGQDMGSQLRQLKRGAQIIVGTPGRVMDHLRRKTLQLDELQSLVLDEADEMLRMGFIDDVEWILEHTPKERQTALFSATMPGPIRKVADRYLQDPEQVQIARESTTGSNIEQSYLMVNGFERKVDAITRLLEGEDFDAMIVFVRTKTGTVELADKLEARGYSASALNGDMNQTLRERTINRLKKKQLDIIVATDVAARGIDVERVSHVLNFDIPYDSEAYVHRIGRTGRAGRQGKAIMFVAPREKRLLHIIEKATKQQIARLELPSGQELSNKRVERFLAELDQTIEQQSLDYFHELLADYSQQQDRSAEEIACALAYLLQREKPLQIADDPKQRKDKFEQERSNEPRTIEIDGETVPLLRYRIEVGKAHSVKPGEIVSTLMREAGVEKRFIGHIKLFSHHSTVEMPEGMPKEILRHLKGVKVCDQALEISLPESKPRKKRANSDAPNPRKRKRPDSRKNEKPKKKRS